MHFADTLIERVRELGHPLCVGLDPHLDRIPDPFRRGTMRAGDPSTAEAVQAFLEAVVDRIEKRVAVVKPQIAFFEQLGWPGLSALQAVVRRCRQRDLLVLLDAKRGDIGSTAEGYARAYLDPDSALPVDAMTVNPYMGSDTLEPYLDRCREHGRGVFVLVKTSNAGSGDLQDRDVEGAPAYEAVARMVATASAELRGPSTGWSSLGVVVGANHPDQAERVRAALPDSVFLVPGYGAQGATAREAVAGFRAGPRGAEGGVVSSSRALLYPAAGGDGWEAAFEDGLKAAISELGEAVA